VNDLLEAHITPLYHFALRLAGSRHAEDLAQETLLRAWRERRSLRDSRVTRVWLLQIAVNVWRDWLRRGRSPVAQAEPMSAECHIGSGTHSPERVLEERDAVQRVLAGLDQLPPRQREVLYLYACEQLSMGEIAAVLETTPSAVKANLSLARKRMRELFPDLTHDLNPAR
jgi:RNA polymerase sigma-70 factor (ECF subfamily)